VEEELQQEQCKWDLPYTPLPKDSRTTTPSRFVAVVVPTQFCDSLVDRLLHRKTPRRRFFLPPSRPRKVSKATLGEPKSTSDNGKLKSDWRRNGDFVRSFIHFKFIFRVCSFILCSNKSLKLHGLGFGVKALSLHLLAFPQRFFSLVKFRQDPRVLD
jgi:hypothetical protein